LLSTIATARSQLDVNIYEIKSEKITKAIVDRIKDGVAVRMLVEGQPVGGVSPTERKNLEKIRDAMTAARSRSNKLFIMAADDKSDRRFVFDHAKYAVVDGATVLVSSDNFSPTGHADAGTVGNRGWDISLDDTALAKQMTAMFESDTDTGAGDVVSVGKGDPFPLQMSSVDSDSAPRARTVHAIPAGQGTVDRAQLLVSPKSDKGLVAFIRSAQDHLEIQHMSYPSQWRESNAAEPFTSPLVSELVAAAQRGVKVRVLLNDSTAFGGGGLTGDDLTAPKPSSNEATVEFLNKLAKQKKLPLQAKIIDIRAVQITYIHNKGMLADGTRTLVSSINGTRNSVMNNREVALVVDGADASEYYGQGFGFDWTASRRALKAATAPEPSEFFVMPDLTELAL
jgi:phosphatidylserine/phosphatidylglycerophosphate/cardiolipin synthase-like enzyme